MIGRGIRGRWSAVVDRLDAAFAGRDVPEVAESTSPAGGYVCPVCGFEDFGENAGVFEFCRCCKFQAGVYDDSWGIFPEAWRERWIAEGCPWRGTAFRLPVPAPPNFSAERQLARIQVKLSVAARQASCTLMAHHASTIWRDAPLVAGGLVSVWFDAADSVAQAGVPFHLLFLTD